MKNDMVECSVCHSKLVSPSSKTYSRAYDRHKSRVSSKQKALNVVLVVGDCVLVGLQPILVYMSKVDGKFNFSPISVNFLTEAAKVLFAVFMLLCQARRQKVGEKPLLSVSTFVQAARNNVLLAVPALLYAINNYLKFTMQLYFNPATVKMLSNLKVLVIAILLKLIMRRRFSVIQWEALALLLIGISVNQLRSLPEGTTAMGLPVATGAYVYTLIFVTVPSMASVFNEYALKSQYDTSIYLQNLFLYGYGAIFNFLGILGTAIIKGPNSFDILQGHSKATMLLICNNAAQGILSSFFFKYADTILKKYSSTVATIFTGFASAALFGHTLTINFMLGISIVFISMHQFFSPLSKVKDEHQNGMTEMRDVPDGLRSKDSFINMAAGANEEVKILQTPFGHCFQRSHTDYMFALFRLHIAQGTTRDSLYYPHKGFN
ncbi:CMP-sialic acid transporter 3 [Turnera subulata]|uniref:CMP-sialic acid transporter 3 n=1 Tax=Turnera subulata TaxID=218843 RepID=A0A9Q0FXE0_9ROSI|nr:CMP-sialic acid transporter 3 [Turnera subulata]